MSASPWAVSFFSTSPDRLTGRGQLDAGPETVVGFPGVGVGGGGVGFDSGTDRSAGGRTRRSGPWAASLRARCYAAGGG